jgi:hypothetical protein
LQALEAPFDREERFVERGRDEYTKFAGIFSDGSSPRGAVPALAVTEGVLSNASDLTHANGPHRRSMSARRAPESALHLAENDSLTPVRTVS